MDNKRNLAVIPARSGSKGVKDKNIRLLNNKPLMAYTIEAAKKSNIFQCIHVSTDSTKYAEIAKQYGAEVPFLRSRELASDTAGTWDTVRFVLEQYANEDRYFDTVTVLQPTSPLRTGQDICNAYKLFCDRKADSVISVCEAEHSPLWCNILPEDGCMNHFLPDQAGVPRQGLDMYYRLNGAIYMVNVNVLLQHGELYGEKAYAYVMEQKHSIDIDEELDFKIAEVLVKGC